ISNDDNNQDEKRINSLKTNKVFSKEDSIDEYSSKSILIKSTVPSNDSHIILSPINENCGVGKLDFEIVWKQSEYKLIIRLIKLENIQSNNHIYFTLDLLPAIRKSTQLESNVIGNKLNGNIDETFIYDGISLDDINYKSIKFSVYDKDSFENYFLGEYRFKLSTIKSDQCQIYSVYLQDKIDCENDEDINERGKVLISLMYSNETSNFHIKIKRACYLLPIDIDQKSNFYCQLCLFSSDYLSNKTNFNVDIKKQIFNTHINQEFIYKNIQLKQLISKTLQITIYNNDFEKKNNFIGGIRLGQSESGDYLKHWFLMIKCPNQSIDMWHNLTNEHF
ncbi:unnamed protein product, partial [Rotaria sp. Silwood1]